MTNNSIIRSEFLDFGTVDLELDHSLLWEAVLCIVWWRPWSVPRRNQ